MKRKIRGWIYNNFPGIAGAFPYYGTTVYFPKNSLVFQLACEQGVYEHSNLLLLLSLIKPNSTFIDIGANIGLMSVPILFSTKSCKVISIEPSPNASPYLKKTWGNSKFRDRWTIIDRAAGNRDGVIDFYMSSEKESAFDGAKDTKRMGKAKKGSVPVTTVDHIWESEGRPNVTAIKIDVEGYEIEVLRGAVQCLKETRSPVLLEINEVNLLAHELRPEILLDFANDNEYSLFSAPYLIPINSYSALGAQLLLSESFLMLPNGRGL